LAGKMVLFSSTMFRTALRPNQTPIRKFRDEFMKVYSFLRLQFPHVLPWRVGRTVNLFLFKSLYDLIFKFKVRKLADLFKITASCLEA
jgi:hypothetical protein